MALNGMTNDTEGCSNNAQLIMLATGSKFHIDERYRETSWNMLR